MSKDLMFFMPLLLLALAWFIGWGLREAAKSIVDMFRQGALPEPGMPALADGRTTIIAGVDHLSGLIACGWISPAGYSCIWYPVDKVRVIGPVNPVAVALMKQAMVDSPRQELRGVVCGEQA